MNITWKTDTDDLFKQCLKLSLMAHVSLVLVWGLKSFILPSKTIVIPNAIRVDLVGLPDKPTPVKKTAAPAKPKPEPEPKAKPEPKTKPKKDNTKSAQQKAMDKLNQLAALDKIKNEKPVEEPAAEEVKPETPQYKGNLLTSGNSFSGLSGIEAQSYWSDVKSHIQKFWALPEWLASATLKASVVVMIEPSGRVKQAEIYQSSGNQAFDEAALTAIEAASPFPVPPERLKDTISNSWMIFNFPE